MKTFKPFIEEMYLYSDEPIDDQAYPDLKSIYDFIGKLSPSESSMIANYMEGCTMSERWFSDQYDPLDKAIHISFQEL